MRFESLENRIVFALDGAAIVEVSQSDTEQEVGALLATATPRSTDDDFVFASQDLPQSTLDALLAESNTWGYAADQFEFTDNLYWSKGIKHQSLTVASEGHLIAERQASDTDLHTMWTAKHSESSCYTSGDLYMQQDYHYLISFDVRHPTSETSWLQDHDWAIVMQMWGPREAGETARNPPFSIYTESENGSPQWVIKSKGDSRLITQSGEYEEENTIKVPYGTIGDWHTWDIEFVPNPFGDGQIRAWLNGELVGELVDVKNIYYSHWQGLPVGPLNPTFGLYGGLADNGSDFMQVHLDDVSIQCNGLYQRSITGVVSGDADAKGHTVIAENTSTGAAISTVTGNAGVYAFNLDPGTYRLSSIHKDTGLVAQLANTVDINSASKTADIEFSSVPVPAPEPEPPAPEPQPEPTPEPPAPEPTPEPEDLPNLTIVGVEASDAQDPNFADNTLDGDLSTRWSAKGDGQTITFDLGIEQTVSQVGIAWYNGDSRDSTFQIEVSADGESWNQVFDGQSVRTASVYDYAVEESVVQFVRIVGFGNTVNTWNSILEVEISGPDPVAVPIPEEPTPEPTPAPPAATPWLNKLTGDLDGDGKDELITRQTDGSWAIYNADTGTESVWGSWSTAVEWHDVMVGDFDGDGLEDLVGRSDQGDWWVSTSTGIGFTTRLWDRWSTSITWTDVTVGDFNGDGRDDLIGRAESRNVDTNQTWWVAESGGESFMTSNWGRWSDIGWNDVMFADFTGDGRTDIAARAATDGTWWVSQSTGDAFNNVFWGTWSTAVDWTDVVSGDFDGDGKADIAGRAGTDGSWWLGRSLGDRFGNEFWGQWSTNVNWTDIGVGDFNGDGKSDIIRRAATDGSWWVAESDGDQFLDKHYANWSEEVDWLFISFADMDGDGEADLTGVDDKGATRIDT